MIEDFGFFGDPELTDVYDLIDAASDEELGFEDPDDPHAYDLDIADRELEGS